MSSNARLCVRLRGATVVASKGLERWRDSQKRGWSSYEQGLIAAERGSLQEWLQLLKMRAAPASEASEWLQRRRWMAKKY